jgi:2-hydroxychromene-2-carboxylate isomerase
MPATLIAIATQQAGHNIADLSLTIMRKCWVEEMDVSEDATLIEAANQCGLDGTALSTASKQGNAKLAYDAYTQEASDKLVFGAPTYIYQDELFWCQDRLDFVERALGLN